MLGLIACLAACSAESEPEVENFAMEFLLPAPGSSYVREILADDGGLVAAVPVEVSSGADIARVELRVGDLPVGDLDLNSRTAIELADVGAVRLVAVGYDASGAEAATAEVELTIYQPTFATCYEYLDLYHVDYERGPDSPGVDLPVTVNLPLNGMSFRYIENAAPRQAWFMDCQLARSLAEMVPRLRAHGVVEVADIGIYNYRCIGGEGTPPNCPQGMSQHSYGTAIDIAGFTGEDGEFYSVLEDWVIDPSGQATCSAATEPGKDEFLHRVICELKMAGLFNIVLTPNYNADHRDHFHCDLTPGEDLIRSLWSVDQGVDQH